MIINRRGDILEDEIVDIIIHGANCFHKMGAGLAKAIVDKYPEVLEKDKQTECGDFKKLGRWSECQIGKNRYIFNAYIQYNYGRDRRYTDYTALCCCLEGIEKQYRDQGYIFGIPWGMGAGLGGGSWSIIYKMVQVIFEASPLELHIVRLDKK